jgi:hypothetical protein
VQHMLERKRDLLAHHFAQWNVKNRVSAGHKTPLRPQDVHHGRSGMASWLGYNLRTARTARGNNPNFACGLHAAWPIAREIRRRTRPTSNLPGRLRYSSAKSIASVPRLSGKLRDAHISLQRHHANVSSASPMWQILRDSRSVCCGSRQADLYHGRHP